MSLTLVASGNLTAVVGTETNLEAARTPAAAQVLNYEVDFTLLAAGEAAFLRVYLVSNTRTDTAVVTSSSATVADTSILTADYGRAVTGVGVPAGTYVGTVTNGVSFLLSSTSGSQNNVNATAPGVAVNIGTEVKIPAGYTVIGGNDVDYLKQCIPTPVNSTGWIRCTITQQNGSGRVLPWRCWSPE